LQPENKIHFVVIQPNPVNERVRAGDTSGYDATSGWREWAGRSWAHTASPEPIDHSQPGSLSEELLLLYCGEASSL